MSTFKGTPGPWVAGYQSEVSGWVDIYIPGYSRCPVAFAIPANADDAEVMTNARLIAAAPDLLEALIDCRRALDLANFTGELAVVDAAIRKATGGPA